MTALFWRRATWTLGLLCVASAVLWIALLGWNPSHDRMLERGPYGVFVPAFAFLAWKAGERWLAAIHRRL